MNNGILAIVSHPDDETFGCGGTLVKHKNHDHDVRVLCLTCNPVDRKYEFTAAIDTLGIHSEIWMEQNVTFSPNLIRRIAAYIDKYRPKVIITHMPLDYHREHKVCYEAVKEAIEWAAHTTTYSDAWQVERLLLMEVNTLIPSPTVLVDISNFFDVKEKAVYQYTSQLSKFSWGYYQKFNQKKAELRGTQCNTEYAEAFLEETITKNGPFYKNKFTELLT